MGGDISLVTSAASSALPFMNYLALLSTKLFFSTSQTTLHPISILSLPQTTLIQRCVLLTGSLNI